MHQPVGPENTSPDPTPAGTEAQFLQQSPLDQAFGALNDPTLLSKAYGEANTVFADGVTSCLTAEGFEYREVPEPAPPPSDFMIVGSGRPTDAVSTFGYGYALNLERVLNGPTFERLPQTEVIRQNQEFIDTLSGASRDAFRRARADCMALSAENVAYPDDLPTRLANEIAEVRAAALALPAVATAWDDWADCMTRAGLPFSSRTESANAVAAEFGPVRQLIVSDGATDDAAQRAASVSELETTIVLADVRCAEAVKLDDRLQETTFEYERRWLENNGDRVTLLLAETGNQSD